MKKSVLYFLAVSIAVCSLKAQNAKFDSLKKELKGFHAYKTANDFFNKKKRNIGEYSGEENGLQVVTNLKTKKKTKFKLQDSAFFAYKVEKGINIMFKPQNAYGTFCGGNKKLYVVVYPPFPNCNYDAENYLYSFDYDAPMETLKWYFVKNSESKEILTDIEEILKDEKDLLEKYQKDKNNPNNPDWNKVRIYTEIAYIKLYNERKASK